MASPAEEHEPRRRLEELLEWLDVGLQKHPTAADHAEPDEDQEHALPFELVTAHQNTPATTPAEETITLWIIDCLHPKHIAALFRFIRTHINPRRKNENERQDVRHLKSVKPIPSAVHPDKTSDGVSILVAKESAISYQDLTSKLAQDKALQDLIERSTPYRIRVPTKRALYEHYMQGGGQDGITNASGWPIQELDDKTVQREMVTGTMKLNQRMLERRWTASEVHWLLTQARLVVTLGLQSSMQANEIGVAAAVSRYSLDVPDELGHLKIAASRLAENPILATAVDVRKSSGNPLRHAVVELTRTVSAQDVARPREPQTPLHPVPYLLTNQIVVLSHEPCLLCTMALLHSRIKHLFFLLPSPGSGGCGSVYHVHEQDGLNHKYFVWKLKLPNHLQDRLKNTFFDA
ncbi:hypothetical protein PCANC_02808 [Puccinia coronata f. sp. avenae]|uniref:CMP/dCMP-type deaminase domain-containing protein n=1 Tax=Puccinia coronata f. sp. avenae TaxID=200324 RepID=A0A2N5W466_9BASI|nr:hypothetical protein PCANC_02808 [Puccinia coronata f. sp. avenae]